jgi:hypothetical protein
VKGCHLLQPDLTARKVMIPPGSGAEAFKQKEVALILVIIHRMLLVSPLQNPRVSD